MSDEKSKFVRETSFAATLGNMGDVSAFVEQTLGEGGCPSAVAMKLMVVCDEIASNVVRYSGADTLRVRVEGSTDGWMLAFSDAGLAWNPLEHVDPDTAQPAASRPVGGLGILLVKKLMDEVQYARVDGWNVFTVRKLV